MILDPINKIKGSDALMEPTSINIDKEFLDKFINQVGINKTIHLDKGYYKNNIPPSSLPIDARLKTSIDLRISTLYDLGAVQKDTDIIVVKGYYEKDGKGHENPSFTLQVPNKIGSVDGEGKETAQGTRIHRWGVIAEVITGGILRLTAYDTGEYEYDRTLQIESVLQKLVAH